MGTYRGNCSLKMSVVNDGVRYSGSSRERTPSGREKFVRNSGAGRLRECKNTEFVWELRKAGFLEVSAGRVLMIRQVIISNRR